MTRSEFNYIIDRDYRRLFKTAYSILNNRQEAEDVVQDVYLRMWMMKEKLDEYDDVTALAVTMTRNSSIDLIRKRKHSGSREFLSVMPAADTSPSPFEQMVSSENRNIIQSIIEELPGEWRDIVRMREIIGFSYEEISAQNGLNINNLRVIVSRARQQIRDNYIKYTNERRKA